MAYVSLYRRHRPQTFAEVVGQRHVTTTLASAVDSDRLHHAYLFTGPRGTGKTSTARILAKSVNCEQGPTSQPDDMCPQCTAIRTGSSVDVIEIDAASHGGVDDVRDLRDRVAFAPASARMKVYIVDECHMLSTAGWNAFLKTVEEPPGHVLFVFATTEPHKVLDTILSRTQRFDFRRISADDLAGHLRRIADAEGLDVEPAALDLLVRAGDGSARDAMSVLEQVIAFTGTAITAAGVRDVLGTSPAAALDGLVAAISDGDVAAACRLVQGLVDAGHDLRQFAKDAVDHLREVFLTAVAPESRLVEATDHRLEALRAQAALVGRAELVRAMELLADAQALMRRGNTRLPLELALAKACLPEASGDPGALAARLDRLERTGLATAARPSEPPTASVPDVEREPKAVADPEAERDADLEPAREPDAERTPDPAREPDGDPEPDAGPGPDSVPPPAAVPAPVVASAPPDDLSRLLESWPRVLDAVKGSSVRLHAMAKGAQPFGLDGDELTLRFPAGHAFHAEQCGSERSQRVIGDAVADVLGSRVRLRCVVDDGDEPLPPVADSEAAAARAAEAAAVAESEAAEAEGRGVDHEEARRRAVELVTRDLGATVLDDEAEGAQR